MYSNIKEKSEEKIKFENAIYYSISKHYKNWIKFRRYIVPPIVFFYIIIKLLQILYRNRKKPNKIDMSKTNTNITNYYKNNEIIEDNLA